MADPAAALHDRFAAAIASAFDLDADPVVRPAAKAGFGDFQVNGAMALAKRLGRPPREVAQAIVDASDLTGVVARTEVAGPGFVNVWLEDGYLAGALDGVAAVPVAPVAERYVVDYSSPTLSKEMHVGHLRSTIIGDALCRLLEAHGHAVVRQNHFGDWGTQFGMLIEHLVELGTDVGGASLADLNAFYQEANARKEGDPAFADRARQRVVLLQGGDAESTAVWRHLIDESIDHARDVYARLGVLLDDGDIRPESSYNDALAGVAADLEAAGLARIDQGALCAFPEGFDIPLMVRKSDEGYGYAATDLAAVRHRIGVLGADHVLYVVDSRQTQHLAMVFAVAADAGWQRPGQAEHVAFGQVLNAEGRPLKTRSGDSPKLGMLLAEAVERAEAVVAGKSPDLPADERTAVARAVGIGAVKYADLASDRVKDYVFDLDRMLAMEGNTAPYLQYAHARIRSIERRAEGAAAAGAAISVGEPAERALALQLLAFGGAVEAAADARQPHRLCTYLFDLAQAFTGFYEACPVLRAPTEELRASRLALCGRTAEVLATGLGLLGIDAPDRM